IAAAVAAAPVVSRLETLSLGLGVLGDAGAEALLAGQPLTHLARLDLAHHYLTEPMEERVRRAFAASGTEVNLADRQEPDDDGGESWRYVAVGE
ncbi:leucine-rich repeat domain-containing protein, partial [Bailinhaonella thermotolerans]